MEPVAKDPLAHLKKAMPSLAPAMERDAPEDCRECGSEDIVEDWAQGNLVCRSCGLVLEEKLVDLGSEWRTFADDKGDDPNRAGGPSNPLLESGPTTMLSKEGSGMGARLSKTQDRNAVSASDKFLKGVFGSLMRMGERSSLPNSVIDRAQEIFKMYYDVLTLKEDGSRSRSLKEEETEEISAASIFLACRNEGVPRTFKEITALSNVAKKSIGVKVKQMEKVLDGVKNTKLRGTEDFVARFCSFLSLPRDLMNASNYVATKAKDHEGVYGRTPISIAAAAIFIVSQLSEEKYRRTMKDISDVCGVAEVTIRVAFKKMHPHIKEILPEDFQLHEKIESLSAH